MLEILKGIEGIRIEKYNINLKKEEIALSILEEKSYLKWDYFIHKLKGECEKRNIKIPMVMKRYPELSFIFSENKSIAEKQKGILKQCLSRKYYLIEKPCFERLTIILKVTNNCNLHCKYCYDMPLRKSLGHNGHLSTAQIEHIIDMLAASTEAAFIIWHGGEPTLCGLDFYKEVYEKAFYKYPYLELESSMQSNGTLLDKEWIAFCKKHNIDIGLSNNYLNEEIRTLPQTTKENFIFEKLKLARICGMPSLCGALEIITKENVDKLIDIYEGYKRRNLKPSFNFVFPAGNAEKNDVYFKLTDKTYYTYIEKYFAHWLYDKEAVPDRFAEVYFGFLLGQPSNLCEHKECRKKFFGINSSGDVYPCDRPLTNDYRFGNINDYDNFVDVCRSEGFRKFDRAVQKHINSFCKKCPIEKLCGRGCPMKIYDKNKNFDEKNEDFCSSREKIFEIAYRLLCNVRSADEINPYLKEVLSERKSLLPIEIEKLFVDTLLENEIEFTANDTAMLNSSAFRTLVFVNYLSENEKHKEIFGDHINCQCTKPRTQIERMEYVRMKLLQIAEREKNVRKK